MFIYICRFKCFTYIRVSFVADLAQNSLKRVSAIFWLHLRNNAFSRMILKWPKARPFPASPHHPPPQKKINKQCRGVRDKNTILIFKIMSSI